jgi:hypothetical protein
MYINIPDKRLYDGIEEFKLMLKCHCACASEFGTCIISDAVRQAAHIKQRKYTFFARISPNDLDTISRNILWKNLIH